MFSCSSNSLGVIVIAVQSLVTHPERWHLGRDTVSDWEGLEGATGAQGMLTLFTKVGCQVAVGGP
jgi:hypothetical protein